MKETACDILILGAGPAGLSAARTLKRAGIGKIVILEREREAGGIPRHCGHRSFGFREFGRWLRGPDYARRLVEDVADLDLRLGWSALELQPGGNVRATGPEGEVRIKARRVLLAMGARETPRSARLISGARPAGIMTTGTLQQHIYLENRLPCRRPVVIGSELVAFSALLTLRHKGARAIALIEENSRIAARRPADWLARIFLGTPILTDTKLLRILGEARVEGIVVERDEWPEEIACDGVIFAGGFRPENALLAGKADLCDPASRGPAIDQFWRMRDPAYFAAGNLLRGIETAGQCWREGRAAALAMIADIEGALPDPQRAIPVAVKAPLKYAYPQFLCPDGAPPSPLLFKARLARPVRGRLRVLADDREIWSAAISSRPERRIAWSAPGNSWHGARSLTIDCEAA